jgi:hypothetical protein
MIGKDFSHAGSRIYNEHFHARALTKQRLNGLDCCRWSSECNHNGSQLGRLKIASVQRCVAFD